MDSSPFDERDPDFLEKEWADLTGDLDDEDYEGALEYLHEQTQFYAPRCLCDLCLTHFYSFTQQCDGSCKYTFFVESKNAHFLIDGYPKEIFSSLKYLRQTVQRDGERILQQWRSASQHSRSSLLLETIPTMAQGKGIDAGKMREYIQGSVRREHLLLPYLDLETLANNPEALIDLLQVRVQYHPQEWVLFDNEQLRRPWALGLLETEFNYGTIIMHGSRYGRYAPWDADAVHRHTSFGFPRGQLILNAQALLMRFLSAMVGRILQSAPPDKAMKRPQTRLPISNDGTWVEIAKQPFSAPPTFDVEAMLSLAKGQREATDDHMWLLQTEPFYFRGHALNISQMKSVQAAEDPEM